MNRRSFLKALAVLGLAVVVPVRSHAQTDPPAPFDAADVKWSSINGAGELFLITSVGPSWITVERMR